MSDNLNIEIPIEETDNPRVVKVAGRLCIDRLETKRELKRVCELDINKVLDKLFPKA